MLIGTNPLPNLVVAEFFLKQNRPPKTIYAIHSPDTYETAKRLETVLHARNGDFNYQLIGISDARDAAKVRNELNEGLPFHPGEQHHLNYTGGTKNMAVQAYNALVEKAGPDRRHLLSFSYLDAQQFKLKSDDGTFVSKDLRTQIDIQRIKDLLDLHDCKIQEREKDDSYEFIDWSPANQMIHQLIQSNQIVDFVKWKNEVIRTLFYDEREKLKKPESITLEQIKYPLRNNIRTLHPTPHPFHEKAVALIQKFPEKQSWKFSKDGHLEINDSNREFRRKKGDFVQGILYLDGFWLEEYVKEVLLDQLTEKDGIRFFPNLHIVKGKAEKDFEIDMILLKGYQLCGISMTTSLKESQCKSKAFEILHRSHQIGGDEARSILITVLDEATVKKLEDDLKHDTGGPISLKILGMIDLVPDVLVEKIRDHMLGE